MPRPSESTARRRPDLGVVAYELMLNGPTLGFIGLHAMPIFPTEVQTSYYPIIPAQALAKLPNTKRAEHGGYTRDSWEFKDGTYKTEEHGLEEPLDDRERKRLQGIYKQMDFENLAVGRAMNKILLSQEKRIADKLFNTSNFTNAAVGTAWSDHANATPIDDVKDAKATVRKKTGLLPNALIIGWDVFEHLTRCADITNELAYTNPMSQKALDAQIATIATALGVERLLVGGAILDSAKKGKPFTPADLWSSSYALLARVSSGARDLEEPCIGRTFYWQEDGGADEDMEPVVEDYRDEAKRADIYRVRHDVDECFVFTGAGYLLTGIS